MTNLIISMALFALIAYLLLCIVPACMADRRGRNSISWFILSVFITPFYTCLILACLGETEQKHKDRIFQEEELRILCRKLNANKENHEN